MESLRSTWQIGIDLAWKARDLIYDKVKSGDRLVSEKMGTGERWWSLTHPRWERIMAVECSVSHRNPKFFLEVRIYSRLKGTHATPNPGIIRMVWLRNANRKHDGYEGNYLFIVRDHTQTGEFYRRFIKDLNLNGVKNLFKLSDACNCRYLATVIDDSFIYIIYFINWTNFNSFTV